MKAKLLKIALLAFVGYIVFMLSRYGYYVHPIGKDRKFFYVPADPITVFTSNTLVFMHTALSMIYYPLWAIDYHLLYGPDTSTVTDVPVHRSHPRNPRSKSSSTHRNLPIYLWGT